MKWSVIGLMVLGLVAAGSAALLVASLQARGASVAFGDVTVPAEPREARIMVARRDLPAFTLVTEEYVNKVTVPQNELVAGLYESDASVIGKITVATMVTGQPFNSQTLRNPGLGDLLPDGTGAFSILLSSAQAGLVYPGALVDVLVVALPHEAGRGSSTSRIALKCAQVIGVNNDSVFNAGDGSNEPVGPKRPDGQRLVTLKVAMKEAETLASAVKSGTVWLVLKSPSGCDKSIQEEDCENWEVLVCHADMCSMVTGNTCSPFSEPLAMESSEPETEGIHSETARLSQVGPNAESLAP